MKDRKKTFKESSKKHYMKNIEKDLVQLKVWIKKEELKKIKKLKLENGFNTQGEVISKIISDLE